MRVLGPTWTLGREKGQKWQSPEWHPKYAPPKGFLQPRVGKAGLPGRLGSHPQPCESPIPPGPIGVGREALCAWAQTHTGRQLPFFLASALLKAWRRVWIYPDSSLPGWPMGGKAMLPEGLLGGSLGAQPRGHLCSLDCIPHMPQGGLLSRPGGPGLALPWPPAPLIV